MKYSIKRIRKQDGSVEYRIDLYQEDGFRTVMSFHTTPQGARHMVKVYRGKA